MLTKGVTYSGEIVIYLHSASKEKACILFSSNDFSDNYSAFLIIVITKKYTDQT